MLANANENLPTDLIGLAEAARLLPSSRAGKRVHCSTISRWVLKGRLRGWRLGRQMCVSRAELLGLLRPVEPPAPAGACPVPSRREQEARRKWTEETLRRFKLA